MEVVTVITDTVTVIMAINLTTTTITIILITITDTIHQLIADHVINGITSPITVHTGATDHTTGDLITTGGTRRWSKSEYL